MSNKNTKKALLTSVLCLLLCCSMLVGTTFAWFTDTVTSGVNQIAAGNLDVDVLVDGESIQDKSVLFDEVDLWEPGVVAYENITVVNKGNLALKYQLEVNFANENKFNGHGLSEVLQVAVVPEHIEETDREKLVESIDTWQKLSAWYENGKLLKNGDSQEYGIVIWWEPSDKDNQWNVNNGQKTDDGKDELAIDLGIKLVATQLGAESDSFGPDYDEGLEPDVNYVSSYAALKEALKNGGTVELMSDITIPADEVITDAASVPVGLYISKDTVLDLNGYDIVMEYEGSAAVVYAYNAELTIVGEGTIAKDGDSGFVIWARNSSDVIGEGIINIYDATISADGAKTALLYADSNVYGPTPAQGGCDFYATINVYSGNYVKENKSSTDAQDYMNVKNHGAGHINLYGGTYNWDLEWMPTSWPNGKDDAPYITVAEGYVVANNGDGTYTVLAGDAAVTNTDELVAAILAGETKIALAAGNYTMPTSFNGSGVSLNGKTLTITGTQAAVIEASHVDERDQYVTDATLAFEGVTLNFGTANYMGFANTASLTYKDCTINGLQSLTGENVVFDNCDLNSNGAEHSAWTWGAKKVTFTDCDFTYADRAVNCYGVLNITTNATFENCTFTKVAGKDTTGAIETNSSTIAGLNLTINNCTVNEGELVYISEYDTLAGANSTITVDGEEIYVMMVGNKWANNESDAAVLKKALSSDAKNIKVILLEDIAIDIGTGWKMGGANTESITIDGNGKTMTLSSTYRSYFNLANVEGKLYLKDMVLTNAHTGTHFFNYTTQFNCNVEATDVVFAKSPLVSGTTAVFTNCEFNQTGTDIYGLWIMSGSNVTVNGGALNTDRGFKITDEDSAEEHTYLTVSGTEFNNTKKAAVLVTTDYGATIEMENVDISKCTADSTNAVWIDNGRADTADQITVTGATVIIEP